MCVFFFVPVSFAHMGRNSLFPLQSVTEAGQSLRWVGGSENAEFVSPEIQWCDLYEGGTSHIKEEMKRDVFWGEMLHFQHTFLYERMNEPGNRVDRSNFRLVFITLP